MLYQKLYKIFQPLMLYFIIYSFFFLFFMTSVPYMQQIKQASNQPLTFKARWKVSWMFYDLTKTLVL